MWVNGKLIPDVISQLSVHGSFPFSTVSALVAGQIPNPGASGGADGVGRAVTAFTVCTSVVFGLFNHAIRRFYDTWICVLVVCLFKSISFIKKINNRFVLKNEEKQCNRVMESSSLITGVTMSNLFFVKCDC